MFKKGLFAVLGGAFLIGASVYVFATPVAAADGWYASGNVGVSSQRDADFEDNFPVLGVNVTAKGEFEIDTGFGLSGAIGYVSGPLRLEGELSYRKNDLDKITIDSIGAAGVLITNIGTFDLGGDIATFGFMGNGYYDFDAGDKWVPFVMAGIGGANINIDVTSLAGIATTYDESDFVFAYQVGAGIGYEFSPTTTANLQYRFFGTADPNFDDGTDKLDLEYQTHNFWVGITQRF